LIFEKSYKFAKNQVMFGFAIQRQYNILFKSCKLQLKLFPRTIWQFLHSHLKPSGSSGIMFRLC